ncbi:MAG TPA: SGNH/GDSL hydrolase family protein [Pirellulaceae bacterium]|nr:SGNH/GDSL hydrolase family protein [Pirellulaceae bacterium]HMO91665.1 SGNH/GDSL hydrolase family protein [Pirellulaceae bacterium]HMP68362.1 SGNH/GDSL hydrolase family protein [Pirellulaceae bacterium]
MLGDWKIRPISNLLAAATSAILREQIWRWPASLIIGSLALFLAASPSSVLAQDEGAFEFDGVVVDKRKYSIAVKTKHGISQVQITGQTQIALRLTRPIIDFDRQKLIVELPISAVSGNANENERLEFDLPSPLWLTAFFNNESQRDSVMHARVPRIVNFDLHGGQVSQLLPQHAVSVSGQVTKGDKPDTLRWIRDDGTSEVILGNRNARLLGFSISDLHPFETDVLVIGNHEDGVYFADAIEFIPVGNPLVREMPGLPRCLFLGDSISFNYQRPLREALAGIVNLHHPPVNCAGSQKWQELHRWLGAYETPGRHWDVITFNFGLWDDSTEKATYQFALREAINQLKLTGAKLVWVTSTPIDYGYHTNVEEGTLIPEDERAGLTREATELVGRVPGRMRLQNDWAREVLADHPEIAVCDLWQVVYNGRNTFYADWWYNKNTAFDYQLSIPLARNLAKHILLQLGLAPEMIHPATVHSAEFEDLSDRE